MESAAPISDMITGLTLYCRLVEDIIEGETELTLTEYRMLFFLSMTPDKRARIHTLAEALYLSASTISDAAKNLEALGFIEKADSRNDLKAVWAVVTKDGRARARPMHNGARRVLPRILEPHRPPNYADLSLLGCKAHRA